MHHNASGNPPPSCENEHDRLAALRRYGILDTPREQAFDDIARLTARICQAPIALVSFVEQTRQWFKSEMGLGVSQTPIDVSICAHALLQEDLFIVPDTLKDERFKNNPLVIEPPHVRFYAGARLRTQEGYSIGTLCVLDYEPRELSEYQADAIRMLARQVMAQLELRRSQEAALAANRAKDRYLAFLAHELRGPMTPALLTAAALADDPGLSPEVRADAAMIRRNIELATRLTDDLLDANRIALGKLELRIEAVDVHASLRGSLSMCTDTATAKSLILATDLKATQFFVNGDPAKLTQVWCNLITNAIKFTPHGGRITLSTGDQPGGRLRVEVRDTGAGVNADQLLRIFNLYEQGDVSAAGEHGGLGLGLAICKGIVEAHGGTISAASEGRGRGTAMLVNLPSMALTLPAAASRPQPVRPPAALGLKILLVDDHADTLRAMSRLLGKLQHRVVTASSVSSALSAAEEDSFDLLISDIGLPDGTGLDLMRQLLKQRPIRGIALTGYGTEADIQETKAAGFAAHLTKPIDFSKLQELIDERN